MLSWDLGTGTSKPRWMDVALAPVLIANLVLPL